jgi:hypothetical protein
MEILESSSVKESKLFAGSFPPTISLRKHYKVLYLSEKVSHIDIPQRQCRKKKNKL